MTGPLEHLDALERALGDAGFPRMSVWWRETLSCFYGSGRRQLVLRVGRRGGKSSTLCRVGVLEALYGEHMIPPGDVGVVAIVSVSRDEAAGRLRTVKAILDALRVPHRPLSGEGHGIELVERAVAFKVYTASIAGVVGGTVICAICDEVAKWKDADTGANPARDVLASLRPALAGLLQAKLFLSSSPLGTLDAHYDAFEAGDSEAQRVAAAPTWVARPELTEQETRALEPDPRIWSREYAAIPQAAALGAFDADAIERAMEAGTTGLTHYQRVLVLDPSSGRKDAWTWCVLGWSRAPASGLDLFVVDDVFEQAGRFFQQVKGAEIVARIATLARERDVRHVHSDQREALMLESEIAKHKLRFFVHDWTNASKQAAVEWLRRMFAESRIILPRHDKLRRELLAFEEKVTPTGAITFGARGSGHDDCVALLVTAAMAELDGDLARAQLHPRAGVVDTLAPGSWEMPPADRWAGMGRRGW